jgi:hypothetical protein
MKRKDVLLLGYTIGFLQAFTVYSKHPMFIIPIFFAYVVILFALGNK